MKKQSVRVNLYEIISRAVEDGILTGYKRAFKHTNTPHEDSIIEHIRSEIMNNLCEVLEFD